MCEQASISFIVTERFQWTSQHLCFRYANATITSRLVTHPSSYVRTISRLGFLIVSSVNCCVVLCYTSCSFFHSAASKPLLFKTVTRSRPFYCLGLAPSSAKEDATMPDQGASGDGDALAEARIVVKGQVRWDCSCGYDDPRSRFDSTGDLNGYLHTLYRATTLVVTEEVKKRETSSELLSRISEGVGGENKHR